MFKSIMIALFTISILCTPAQANIAREHITTMFKQNSTEKRAAFAARVTVLIEYLDVLYHRYAKEVALGHTETVDNTKRAFSDCIDEIEFKLNHIVGESSFKKAIEMRILIAGLQLQEMESSFLTSDNIIIQGGNAAIFRFAPMSWSAK